MGSPVRLSITFTDIDECSSNPCTNGAVCVDKVNHYICTCPPGFTGAQCDISKCAAQSNNEPLYLPVPKFKKEQGPIIMYTLCRDINYYQMNPITGKIT